LASNERAATEVEVATAGAIQAEIFALLRSPDAMGVRSELRIGATLVRLVAENEASRLNPNRAQAIELAALLQQVGADALSSAAIAAAILDWRTDGTEPRRGGAKAPQYRAAGRGYGPPGTPFRSLGEIGQVLGMTPILLERLRPHLTVFTDFSPFGVSSDPVVARALQTATQAGALPQGGDLGAIAIVRITAVGYGPYTASVTLQAIVRLNATPSGLPFEVLSWQHIAT
jgi:general secretion pathway protein K